MRGSHRRTEVIGLPIGMTDVVTEELRALTSPMANFGRLVEWLERQPSVRALCPTRVQVSTAVERLFACGHVKQEDCVGSLEVGGRHRLRASVPA